MAPNSLDRGKGPRKQLLRPTWHQGGRRKRGDAGCVAPTDRLFWTPPQWGRGGRHSEASEDYRWGRGGRLPGPGRTEARQSSATTTIRSAATATATTIGPAATTSGAAATTSATTAAGAGAAGFLPSTPKVAPAGGSGAQKQASARSGAGDPPPAAAAETAPPGSHAPAGGSAAAVPLTATVASTMVMPSSTPSIAAGDVGGASSSIPSPTLEETEVVLGWWLRSGAEPETAAVERIQKWERELEDKASNIALAEENLKEKDASLDKRATDLAWREKDLAFMEEMFERWDKLLVEHELEAKEKEKKLEERIRQF
eukprot:XP_008650557.1 nucleoporin NSP1-like [Zea mays]